MYNVGFQTLNSYSFRIQPMWPKCCLSLVTRYDLLSQQNFKLLTYLFLFWKYPPLYTSRLVAMLWQHQRLVYKCWLLQCLQGQIHEECILPLSVSFQLFLFVVAGLFFEHQSLHSNLTQKRTIKTNFKHENRNTTLLLYLPQYPSAHLMGRNLKRN